MKKLSLIGCLAIGMGVAVSGCKSAPKLAWWKKDSASAIAAADPAKPADPADAAKLAAASENASKLSVAQGGLAPPFVPSTSTGAASSEKVAANVDQLVAAATAPSAKSSSIATGNKLASSGLPSGGGYPSTGVPPLSPGSAIAAVTSATRDAQGVQGGASLGAIGLPYDPQAIPGGRTTDSLAASASSGVSAPVQSMDRYTRQMAGQAAAALDTGGADAQATLGSAQGALANGYRAAIGNAQSAVASGAPAHSPAAGVDRYGLPLAGGAASVTSASNAPASRYANSQSSGARQATTSNDTDVATTPEVGGSDLVAGEAPSSTRAMSNQPYRPGGTSTYPAAQLASTRSPSGSAAPAPVEIASRPETGYSSGGGATSAASPYSSVPFAPGVPSASTPTGSGGAPSTGSASGDGTRRY